MKLDKLTVNVRPLPSFQATDLGMTMARHWFIPLWQLWWRRMLPMFIIVLCIMFYQAFTDNAVGFSGLLLFWLMLMVFYLSKPYAEIPLVIYLSQRLFNENLTSEQVWQQLKQIPRTGIFSSLKFHITPRRQMLMPIVLLEQQTRKERKMRLKVLTKSQNNAIAWHTTMFQVIEILIYLGILVFMFHLVPENIINETFFDMLFNEMSWVVQIIAITIYLLVTSILSVFYIASGFAVYICKRSQLEGWDIELKFRQLAQRHAEINQQLSIKKPQQEQP